MVRLQSHSTTCAERQDTGEDPSHWACGEDSGCINRLTQVECPKDDCRCKKYCQNQRYACSKIGGWQAHLVWQNPKASIRTAENCSNREEGLWCHGRSGPSHVSPGVALLADTHTSRREGTRWSTSTLAKSLVTRISSSECQITMTKASVISTSWLYRRTRYAPSCCVDQVSL